MTSFPSVTLAREYVKLRFLEESAPKGVNDRLYAMPRGVYAGFVPAVSSGSSILSLGVDGLENFSLLKVGGKTTNTMVDVFTDSVVTLDFGGHTVFPVYVLATADYSSGSPTYGRIFTRSTGASGASETTICVVDKVADELTVSTTVPTHRRPPVAHVGQSFGYMVGGSVENLSAASLTTAEIIAARTSAASGAHASLSARIEGDLSGQSMADRLMLRQSNVLSNSHGPVVASTLNVSGSFTETGRATLPALTISAGGDVSTEGAITDAPNNVVFVVDADTGERLVEETSREPIFADLSFTTGSIGLGRQIRFFNATTTISGNGSNPFQAPLEEGDIVLAPDGLYYEITLFTDPDNAELAVAYRGAGSPDTQVDATYRRFTLSFQSTASGAVTPPASPDVKFAFPCFFRLDTPVIDALLLLRSKGERPELPASTSVVEGKGLLAVDSGVGGSIRTVKDSTVLIDNDVHTLNFVSGGASDATGGVANIAVTGPKGPDGAAADQGDKGLVGANGAGYTVNNSFEVGPTSGSTGVAGTDVTVTFIHDFTLASSTPQLSDPIAHVNGGFASFREGFNANERIQIDSISKVGTNQGMIVYRIEPDPWLSLTLISGFLGASS